ncbi:MAG: rhodanese-like domain-containing protein [Rickettsia endosymbiont of Bryobia graminum]|nr:rhodanese-like domain-containing protein [Rickettsia endosymbiont of Bryobia graminum]
MNIKNISSLNAHEMLQIDSNTLMIDVRTIDEWKSAGIPRINKNQIIFLSWRLLPGMLLNNQFKKQFMTNTIDQNNALLFLCRSGIRSKEAAEFISNLGYSNCYNISDGFEGGVGGIGWKQNDLPWQLA